MNEEIITLLRKYINAQCSRDETDSVLILLQEGAYPAELDFVLAEVSEEAILAALDNTEHDKTDAVLYERIKRSIADRQHGGSTAWRWPRVAVAAVVLISLGLGLYTYFADDKGKLYVSTDVRAGSNRAYLILADGRKIALEEAANGQLAEESGIRIRKTDDGQIVYEIQGTDGKSVTSYAPTFNTIETPRGGQYQVVLSDGTRVWLNSDSRLTYPSRFSGRERLVEVQGEAYFEVETMEDMPFKVRSSKQLVQVLGTHFNVTAYPEDEITTTTLLEGAVQIVNLQSNLLNQLSPGEQAQLSGKDTHVTKDIDLEEIMAWKNGYFKFSESLESIMTKVARWYDVEIVYADNFGEELQFYGKISRSNNLSAILDIISSTGNVRFRIESLRKTNNAPATRAERRVVVMK